MSDKIRRYRITWENGVVQEKVLINHCRQNVGKRQLFTMNSPIYQAIENGSFQINLGYGTFKFSILEILNS